MMSSKVLGSGLLLAAFGVGCGGQAWQSSPCPSCPVTPLSSPNQDASGAMAGEPTVAEAQAFMTAVDADFKAIMTKAAQADWVNMNFITGDTQALAARANQATMEYLGKTIKAATRFDGLTLPPKLARQFKLLKLASMLPAPSDSKKTAELATISASLGAAYGKGKYCPTQKGSLRRELAKDKKGKGHKEALACAPGKGGVSLGVLTRLLATSRNEAALKEAWVGWRTISPPMLKSYQRLVSLGNEGAREIGFNDLGELWRSGYDMSPEAFRGETDRLYSQVKPFYEELHCYARKQLRGKYGEKVVKSGAPIPAHLLGNMWSQTWGNIYPMLEPHKGQPSVDVTKALVAAKYDEVKMVKTAEGFFTSLGLDPLPKTFWERSLFKKPRDREVVCHASAWDVNYTNDLRIKMCIEITGEDLQTVHHELGHNYYYQNYYKRPMLFQNGANDGFHEAIGDAIALSITPGYLKKIGLLRTASSNEKAELNYLLKMALDKVAFLPFGKLIDEWRWDVFAGRVKPADYNKSWWQLRTKYQGIAPPVARGANDFDPGAKYHVPGNVPYTRYFLAFIYQFQFQRALCRLSGHEGPLHSCSIYGNKKAGAKLQALLKLGASQPWQDALFAMTGERRGDAGALLEYFQPLRGWLQTQIKDERCGW